MELAVGSKKIAIFYRKSEKTARRSQAKRRITRFLLFARKRNAESPVFYSSLVSETQNRPISAFLPREKIKNAQFLRFSLERKSK